MEKDGRSMACHVAVMLSFRSRHMDLAETVRRILESAPSRPPTPSWTFDLTRHGVMVAQPRHGVSPPPDISHAGSPAAGAAV